MSSNGSFSPFNEEITWDISPSNLPFISRNFEQMITERGDLNINGLNDHCAYSGIFVNIRNKLNLIEEQVISNSDKFTKEQALIKKIKEEIIFVYSNKLNIELLL